MTPFFIISIVVGMVEQQLANLLVGNHVIILTLLDAAEVEIGVLLHGLEEAV